jgi:hypothetical protein
MEIAAEFCLRPWPVREVLGAMVWRELNGGGTAQLMNYFVIIF